MGTSSMEVSFIGEFSIVTFTTGGHPHKNFMGIISFVGGFPPCRVDLGRRTVPSQVAEFFTDRFVTSLNLNW